MTSSANDEWNSYELIMAVHLIYKTIRLLEKAPANEKNSCKLDIKSLQHAIDFIEYNMRELEITGGNGD